MPNPLSVLIIGCGNIAGGYDEAGNDKAIRSHAGAYKNDDRFRVVACILRTGRRREWRPFKLSPRQVGRCAAFVFRCFLFLVPGWACAGGFEQRRLGVRAWPTGARAFFWVGQPPVSPAPCRTAVMTFRHLSETWLFGF